MSLSQNIENQPEGSRSALSTSESALDSLAQSVSESLSGAAQSTHSQGGLTQNPVDIHRALDQVRQLPEFKEHRDTFLDKLFQDPRVQQWLNQIQAGIKAFFDKLGEFLEKLTPHVQSAANLPPGLTKVLNIVVSIILAFVVLMLFYVVLSVIKRWYEKRAKPLPVMNKPFDETILINSAYHQKQALQCSGKGDYNQAVRQLYLASLCYLDEQQVVRYSETLSNWEYRSLLKVPLYLPALGSFVSLSKYFENYRFGHIALTEADYRQSLVDFQDLSKRVRLPHSGKLDSDKTAKASSKGGAV